MVGKSKAQRISLCMCREGAFRSLVQEPVQCILPSRTTDNTEEKIILYSEIKYTLKWETEKLIATRAQAFPGVLQGCQPTCVSVGETRSWTDSSYYCYTSDEDLNWNGLNDHRNPCQVSQTFSFLISNWMFSTRYWDMVLVDRHINWIILARNNSQKIYSLPLGLWDVFQKSLQSQALSLYI